MPFSCCLRQIDEHLRFMILKDEVHPELDTCIIVEYKGSHHVLCKST